MRKRLILYSFLGLLIAFILTPDSPAFREITAEDPGMFLYAGEQILTGKIPYLDFWDHKGPLIYYLNALGLATGFGRWGVLLLEFLAIFIAAFLGFKLMRQAFGVIPAFFGTGGWLVSLILVLDGGNLTEEFALPFQFLALYLFWQGEEKGFYPWRGFLIGITAGLTFLLRPNLIGVYLSIIIFLLVTRMLARFLKGLTLNLLAIFLGAAVPIFATFFYFWVSGALGEFLDVFFRFNFFYSSSTIISAIKTILIGFWIMSRSGMSFIVLAGWILGIYYLLTQRIRARSNLPIIGLAIITLPVELALSSISGIHPAHYYTVWLPAFSLIAGFFAFALIENLKVDLKFQKTFLIILLLGMSLIPITVQLYRVFPENNPQRCADIGWFLAPSHHQFECKDTKHKASQYIKSSTTSNDYVLIWGFGPSLNFYTKRPSPSRFVYQYPLFLPGYSSQSKFEKFVGEIIAKNPRLIIDASRPFYQVPPINKMEREKWQGVRFSQMNKLFEYIDLNYKLVDIIGQDQWAIYKYSFEQ